MNRISLMPQLSKMTNSRNSWRNKAVIRSEALREARKTQKRHRRKITELKLKNKNLQEEIDDKKNN